MDMDGVDCLLIVSNFSTVLGENWQWGIAISVFSIMFVIGKVKTNVASVLPLVP